MQARKSFAVIASVAVIAIIIAALIYVQDPDWFSRSVSSPAGGRQSPACYLLFWGNRTFLLSSGKHKLLTRFVSFACA